MVREYFYERLRRRADMAGDTYPRFRAAAVQAAPVFLDREATISRLAGLVAKARDVGADLVVFGESFIPAFPLWNMLYAPVDQHAFYRRLFENAIEVPGPQVEQLGEIARRHGVVLSVGVTEKGPVSMGAMWNTNLIFSTDGRLLNRHRKLVPTWAEKLTWSNGDASHLRVERTGIGRVGALICGENIRWLGLRCLRRANKSTLQRTRPLGRHAASGPTPPTTSRMRFASGRRRMLSKAR